MIYVFPWYTTFPRSRHPYRKIKKNFKQYAFWTRRFNSVSTFQWFAILSANGKVRSSGVKEEHSGAFARLGISWSAVIANFFAMVPGSPFKGKKNVRDSCGGLVGDQNPS